MIELIDENETYVLEHPSGSKFTFRYWTRGMQDEVDTRCLVSEGGGKFRFNVPLERELKVHHCLVGWEGVSFKGEIAPCNDENKKKLPLSIFLWIIEKIDERAGVRLPEEEKKN